MFRRQCSTVLNYCHKDGHSRQTDTINLCISMFSASLIVFGKNTIFLTGIWSQQNVHFLTLMCHSLFLQQYYCLAHQTTSESKKWRWTSLTAYSVTVCERIALVYVVLLIYEFVTKTPAKYWKMAKRCLFCMHGLSLRNHTASLNDGAQPHHFQIL